MRAFLLMFCEPLGRPSFVLLNLVSFLFVLELFPRSSSVVSGARPSLRVYLRLVGAGIPIALTTSCQVFDVDPP